MHGRKWQTMLNKATAANATAQLENNETCEWSCAKQCTVWSGVSQRSVEPVFVVSVSKIGACYHRAERHSIVLCGAVPIVFHLQFISWCIPICITKATVGFGLAMFWKRSTQNEGLSPAAVFFNTKQQQWERVWPGAIIPSFADQPPQLSDDDLLYWEPAPIAM